MEKVQDREVGVGVGRGVIGLAIKRSRRPSLADYSGKYRPNPVQWTSPSCTYIFSLDFHHPEHRNERPGESVQKVLKSSSRKLIYFSRIRQSPTPLQTSNTFHKQACFTGFKQQRKLKWNQDVKIETRMLQCTHETYLGRSQWSKIWASVQWILPHNSGPVHAKEQKHQEVNSSNHATEFCVKPNWNAISQQWQRH